MKKSKGSNTNMDYTPTMDEQDYFQIKNEAKKVNINYGN